MRDPHESKDESYRHKWWGWGPEGLEYDMHRRPDFWPWICRETGLPDDATPAYRISRDSVQLPARKSQPEFEHAVTALLGTDRVRHDDDDRIAHSFGRSYRDLVRLRAGLIDHPPDVILYPQSHDDVVAIVRLAGDHDVTLIPFGGGTNIVGCVEPSTADERMVATLDMRLMNRLLALDKESMTADLEPGLFGPQLERLLNAQGCSLGHHPDSFQFSTLGGWLATRSAGTQSNIYGKIEDMVLAMRVVTPSGIIETKSLPAASNGPDLNRIIVGSEGTFGIITRATMRVHPVPEFEEYRLLLFPSFADGFRALRECVARGVMPSMARLSDEAETELIFAAKYPSSGVKRILNGPIKRLRKARGYSRPAALVVAFEGTRKVTRQLRHAIRRILRQHRAFDLGTGAGEAWKASRYDVPLLRDYLMDYGFITDSFETSTVWSNMMPLYGSVTEVIRKTFEEVTGFVGYVGGHISHLYGTGACLYYTVGGRSREGSTPEEMIEQYTTIKHAATSEIMRNGGALSHHHAVGYEHQPWIEQELSATGVRSLTGLKLCIDPQRILNPGSLLPDPLLGPGNPPD